MLSIHKYLRLFFLCALCAFGGEAVHAQCSTQVTGTFKTPTGQTPSAAGIPQIGTVAGTAVYGTATFTPYNHAGFVATQLQCQGINFAPQPITAWIKADGTLMSNAGGTLALVPTRGSQPEGAVYNLAVTFPASSDGAFASVTWSANKEIPGDVPSVDWGNLSHATPEPAQFSYQLQNAGAVLDYEVWYLFEADSVPTPAAGRIHLFFDDDTQVITFRKSDGSLNTLSATITAAEVDGAPSFAATTLQFDQADGFVLTNPIGTTARVDLNAVPDSVLAQITTAAKVSGAALTALGSVPAGAGDLPLANLADGSGFLKGAGGAGTPAYASITAGDVDDGGAAATQALFSGAAGAAGFRAIADGDVPDNITITLSATATALAANGANCSAGNAPLGVDASGAAEGCFAVQSSDQDLTDIAGLTRTRGDLIVGGVSAWTDLAIGANLAVLASNGTDPAWTALTDAHIPDTITASNYLLLAGGVLTGNLEIDNQLEVRLRELDANGDNYIGFRSIASRTANLTLEWAVTAGCDGNLNGGSLTINASLQIVCSDDDGGGGGSGDAVEVEDGDNAGTFTAIDTTARFDDSGDINFTFTDGGAGGPDVVTATIRANSVELTTDTTGNYVLTVTAGTGVAVTGADAEGATKTVAFDFSDAGADPALAADECRFSNEGASAGGWVCEGATANTIETRFRVTDPTSTDKIITFPDLTGTVALSANKLDFFAATSSAELASVLSDESGAAGVFPRFSLTSLTTGDLISWDGTNWVNSVSGTPVNAQTGTTYTVVTGDRGKLVTLSNAAAVAVTLPQSGSAGFDGNWFAFFQNRGAGTVTITPTTSTVDGAASITLEQNDGILIAGDNTNYFTSRGRLRAHTHASAAQGGTLDATAIASGQISAARGGTGDDTSATTGVPRIATGNWTYDAGISHLASSSSADLRTTLSDENGTGAALFNSATNPTFLDATIDDLLTFLESAGDATCAAGDYWIKGNSTSGKLRGCENGTLGDLIGGGGSVAWSALTSPTAATNFVSDATAETIAFDFQAAFTTGSQFLIKSSIGNPTSGVLLEILGHDADVTILKAGDGTNGISLSAAGALSAIGTGVVNANQFKGNATVALADGGTGQTSFAAGLLRSSGSVLSSAELSGDVTTSASNAVTLATKFKSWSSNITIFDPVTGDTNRVQLKRKDAVTITRVSCSVAAATSVTIQFDERAEATPNTAGTNVMTAALVCDTTNGGITTSFTNAGIAAGAPLNLQITAVTGTPGTVRIHVEGTID